VAASRAFRSSFSPPGSPYHQVFGQRRLCGAMMFRVSPTNVDLGVSFDWGAETERPDQSPRAGKTTLATSAQGATFANVPRVHLLRLLGGQRTVTVITTRYGHIRPPPHLSVHLQRTRASDIGQSQGSASHGAEGARKSARGGGAGGTPVSSRDVVC